MFASRTVSIGLHADIADMRILIQIISSCYNGVFDAFALSRTVPSNVYEAWALLVSFFVSCLMLHLTGWNCIPYVPSPNDQYLDKQQIKNKVRAVEFYLIIEFPRRTIKVCNPLHCNPSPQG